jgi:predicted LPLAT superfamily acyltransferase
MKPAPERLARAATSGFERTIAAGMKQSWVRQSERGSVFAMKLLARLSLRLGRRLGRALLYPVCGYFLLFSRAPVRASRRYLGRVLGRRATLADVFRHYHCFASTLLDRPFLLSGRSRQFVVRKHGSELLRSLRDQGRGCLLLGAHLGSFELARACAEEQAGVTVNMLMYEDNARKINTVLEDLGVKGRMRVIPIGGIETLLTAKERVDRGEMLGILGDRAVANDKVVRVPFLGAPAVFPAGPILLANALAVPVLLFFGLYRGANRYEEYFELLAERIALDPRRRQAELENWVGRYAARLEHYCRLAPYNWFNFYDFWEQDQEPHPGRMRSAA